MLAILQSALTADDILLFGSLANAASPKGDRIPLAWVGGLKLAVARMLGLLGSLPTADDKKISGPSFLHFVVPQIWRLDSPEGFERGKVCHERHVGTSSRLAPSMTSWSAWRAWHTR